METNTIERKYALLTTKEAAELWNIPASAIHRMVKSGILRPIIGIDTKWRFRPNDLEEAGVYDNRL